MSQIRIFEYWHKISAISSFTPRNMHISYQIELDQETDGVKTVGRQANKQAERLVERQTATQRQRMVMAGRQMGRKTDSGRKTHGLTEKQME